MASKGADAITTIQLRKATRDRLVELGRKGETYDDILNRLLDHMATGSHATAQAPSRAPSHRKPSKGVVDFEPVD